MARTEPRGAAPSATPTVSGHRIVFHVDMDAFYAAVEARERPELAGVPVVIGADPRGGKGRGVAATANYAARQYGIHSAMPISKAYALCPHAVFLRPDFRKYRQASDDVMAVLARYAEVLEVVGLDEAYLDMTHATTGDWDRARNVAHSLQAAIRRETGLSASIGIAPNKAVAKIASDHRKPHGITVVAPDDVEAFLDPLPVRLINGCGPKTAARLIEWGVETVGDLARSPRAWLEERFGSHGTWLWRIARGDDPRQVQAERGPRKSRGNERTFLRDERDMGRVRQAAYRLLDELMQGGDAAATLTVKLRYHDYTTLTRAHTLSVPLDRTPTNADLARATLDALLDPLLDGRAVRLVGVRWSGFRQATGQARLADFALSGVTGRSASTPATPPSL